MSVSYKLLTVDNPGTIGKRNKITKPMVVIHETISPEMFIDNFAREVRFSKPDIIKFIYSLKQYIMRELRQGNIVQTGAIGSFYPIVNTKKDKNNNSDGFEAGINYRASMEMIRELREEGVVMVE